MNTPTQAHGQRDDLAPFKPFYGADTLAIVADSPLSTHRLNPTFIAAMGQSLLASAKANAQLGAIDERLLHAIQQACDELESGQLCAHFPLDRFQSQQAIHRNLIEVVAHRCHQLLNHTDRSGLDSLQRALSQNHDANDLLPTSAHVAAASLIHQRLLPALRQLSVVLASQATQLSTVVKPGRVQLVDQSPITLGQEFNAFNTQLTHVTQRIKQGRNRLLSVAIGGAKVGSGFGVHPQFVEPFLSALSEAIGLPFREERDHFAAQSSCDGLLEAHAPLNSLALGLNKMANDLRLLSHGRQLLLSFKSMSDLTWVNGVVLQVLSNQQRVDLAAMNSQLQSSPHSVLVAHGLIDSAQLLSNALIVLSTLCATLVVDRKHCSEHIERSLCLSVGLQAQLGQQKTQEITEEARRTGRSVGDVARTSSALSPDQLHALLQPLGLTHGRR